MRFVLGVLIASVLLFTAVAGLAWWGQERVVFQPPAGPWPLGDGARRVEYVAADGQRLFGYLVTPDDTAADTAAGAPRRVLLAFHGNADLAAWQIDWAQEVARRTGVAVLCAEYRGYAGAGGAPTYAGSRLDARAAYDFVRDSLGVAPGDVVLFGHSLGSAVAAELASEVRPRALLLQSPFTSARDMARIVAARPVAAVWNVIARVHFDTEKRVATLDAPVSVAHGTDDWIIPVRMGQRVHAAARVPGELLLVEGAGHNDVVPVGGERYWEWVERSVGTGARSPEPEEEN